MADDWRITCGGGEERTEELLAALPEGVGAHRADDCVVAYAADEESAERMHAQIAAVARSLGIETRLERWNPGTFEWQPPDRPVAEAPSVPFGRGDVTFLVRARFPTRELAQQAYDEPGRFAFGRLRPRVVDFGARDQDDANQLANDLRLLSTEVEVDIQRLPEGRIG
jgi:hypothetical protein